MSGRNWTPFRLIVGALLVLVGLWVYPRSDNWMALVFIAAGVFSVVAAFHPPMIVGVYRIWMRFAELLSAVMSRVILAIVFALVVTPIGIVRRLSGADPLRRRAKESESHWSDYPVRQRSTKHYEKMY